MPRTQFPVAKRPIAAPDAAKPRQRRTKRAGIPSQCRSTASCTTGPGRSRAAATRLTGAPQLDAEARARRERLAAATARAS